MTTTAFEVTSSPDCAYSITFTSAYSRDSQQLLARPAWLQDDSALTSSFTAKASASSADVGIYYVTVTAQLLQSVNPPGNLTA